MIKLFSKFNTIILFVILGNISSVYAAQHSVTAKSETNQLTLDAFIAMAVANDTTFESILIDQMPLQYRRTLLLPDSDIIIDVKYTHHFYLEQDRDNPAASISLSKLFPYNGTELSLTYNKDSSRISTTEESSLQFLISQPIARNAFGKATRLQDEIIGIENDISRYQIVEAYEDYLSALTTTYYNWYSAYENLKVGKASYRSNQKLMDNILDRQRQNIALPIDVNKMALLLISKQENQIALQEIYDNITNLIYKAIQHKDPKVLIPVKPTPPPANINFEPAYQDFKNSSRTYRVLQLLEKQGTLEVKKAADDLLPSTNLLLGYTLDGSDWGVKNSEDTYFAGIELRWPVERSVDKAREQIAKIEHKKTLLSNQNKYEELRTNLKNIYLQIQREEKLLKTAQKKIKLAKAVLKDEARNYSFGKVTLNDYIDAVNLVDETRFSFTEHTVQLNKLLIEWLRLTDQLVNENEVLKSQDEIAH